MINYAIIVLVFNIIDKVFSYVFTYDYSLFTISFITQLAFMALMLISRKCTLKQSLILALALGIAQDVFGNITFSLYIFVNIAMVFLSSFWTNNMTDTWFENLLFVLIIIFVRDSIIFLIMKATNMTNLSIMNFMVKREFASLVMNGLLFFIVHYLVNFTTQIISDKDVQLRSHEHIYMYDLKAEAKK